MRGGISNRELKANSPSTEQNHLFQGWAFIPNSTDGLSTGLAVLVGDSTVCHSSLRRDRAQAAPGPAVWQCLPPRMLPWFVRTELGITAPDQALLPAGSLSAPGGWERSSPYAWSGGHGVLVLPGVLGSLWGPFVASLVSAAPLGSLCGCFGFFVVSVAPLQLLWGLFVASLRLLCGFSVEQSDLQGDCRRRLLPAALPALPANPVACFLAAAPVHGRCLPPAHWELLGLLGAALNLGSSPH